MTALLISPFPSFFNYLQYMSENSRILNIQKAFEHIPGIVMVLLPDPPLYTIVDATDAVMNTVGIPRDQIIGKGMFIAFPGNTGTDGDGGQQNLRASLDTVVRTKQPHEMPVQRYDLPTEDGAFNPYYWKVINTPVLNEAGEVECIIHSSEDVTGDVVSKREALTTRENFEYFFHQAIAPFAILSGPEFKFTFTNNAYRQLMNGRELVGKTLAEAIPELEGQPFVKLLEEVYNSGVPYNASEIPATAYFDADTMTTRYFNLSYTPYKNQEGKIEGVLASGYDVTSHVELKKKDINNVLNIQAYDLFMQAPVGFSLLIGDEHRLIAANETGLKIAGMDSSIIGKTVTEIIPGIERQGYIDLLNSVKQTGQSVSLRESPVTLHKNGKEETIYVDLVYQPYFNAEGIAGVLSISTDVTEQVLARKESERMREHFEMMTENMPNLAWLAKPDGWIFWYNSRWYEYTGTTVADMAGWGWQSVHDPEKLPAVMDRWQASIDTKQPFEMVYPIRGADRIFRPFLTRVIPIYGTEGKLLWWLGTNTDITKQKEVEQMKDDFLSMASHELKTPLTTIKAYGQLVEAMLEQHGEAQALAMVKKMSTQVNKLTTLVDDLLDINKIQQGKLVFNESHFDFNTLVSETIDDIQKTTSKHRIHSELNPTGKLYADPIRVGQIVNNLVSNAIKYSPNHFDVTVTTQADAEGIRLSVQDSGIGIPASEQKNIFDQFYRVNGDSQVSFTGMGIGLYICAEIVRRMNGRIWVESAVKKGSTFHVLFPVSKVQ
jgi:PAS domain S-box-containing protein